MTFSFDSRPKHSVHVVQSNERYLCALDESLLRGMLRLGRKGIPAGCVSGGCGVCKVRILEGGVKPLGPVSRAHVTPEEELLGFTLACRVAPTGAVRLEIAGKLTKPFSNEPTVSAAVDPLLTPQQLPQGDPPWA